MLGSKLDQIISDLSTAIVAAILAAITWIIRRVLTNQRLIELLQAEIRHRDEQRREDREAVQEVREDMKAIRGEIRDIARAVK